METIITDILNKMNGLSRIRKKFLIHIFVLFLSIRGRLNFMNMSRIGGYSEKSFRTHFEQPFDFFAFSSLLAEETCSGHRIIAGDCSYIPKSGKMTPHLGKFWNGCASKAEKGLEISSLAVVDVERNTAMHLECLQTSAVPNDGETRMDFYLRQIVEKKDQLKRHADYMVNDGAYAKKKYVDGIVNQTDLHLISKLRKDANLRYLYTGPKTGRKGHPKTYDGKVKCKNIDKSRFILCYENDEIAVYSAVVNSKSLKRNIRAAYVENRKSGGYVILFSTDTQLNGFLIYRYYKARFQIEFLFRDAKQHTGLNHCQARSENKLYFHFNTSLTSVSIAKAAYHMKDDRADRPFSMNNVKTFCFNKLFLKRFMVKSEIDQTCTKISDAYHELLNFGKIIA
jgi:hypothetical protein